MINKLLIGSFLVLSISSVSAKDFYHVRDFLCSEEKYAIIFAEELGLGKSEEEAKENKQRKKYVDSMLVFLL